VSGTLTDSMLQVLRSAGQPERFDSLSWWFMLLPFVSAHLTHKGITAHTARRVRAFR
jgi:hypothetical protein